MLFLFTVFLLLYSETFRTLSWLRKKCQSLQRGVRESERMRVTRNEKKKLLESLFLFVGCNNMDRVLFFVPCITVVDVIVAE